MHSILGVCFCERGKDSKAGLSEAKEAEPRTLCRIECKARKLCLVICDRILSPPQRSKKNMENEPKTIEWEAAEYEHGEKSADWFWAVGIITLAAIVSAFLLKNFLLGILSGLIGFSISLYGARKPATVKFKLGPRGVQIGNKLYDYENLASFWVEYDPPRRKELILKSKKALVPHINIMLGDADPGEIREYLSQFLEEEKIEESWADTISKIAGF